MELAVARRDDEALLLELLNSTPVVDGVQREILDTAWLRAHDLPESDLEDLMAARNVLQGVVRGNQDAGALSPFVSTTALRPIATTDGMRWNLAADGITESAARVVLAWDALRINSPGRLRPCANDECRLFLIDRSKPNSARWCSMTTCGNRMKARRHYQRAKT